MLLTRTVSHILKFRLGCCKTCRIHKSVTDVMFLSIVIELYSSIIIRPNNILEIDTGHMLKNEFVIKEFVIDDGC